jgi:hypothetical protein
MSNRSVRFQVFLEAIAEIRENMVGKTDDPEVMDWPVNPPHSYPSSFDTWHFSEDDEEKSPGAVTTKPRRFGKTIGFFKSRNRFLSIEEIRQMTGGEEMRCRVLHPIGSYKPPQVFPSFDRKRHKYSNKKARYRAKVNRIVMKDRVVWNRYSLYPFQ